MPGADGQRRFFFIMKPAHEPPGAGRSGPRGLRRQLSPASARSSPTRSSRCRSTGKCESDVWATTDGRTTEDWLPGTADAYLKIKYRQADRRTVARKLNAVLDETAGVKAMALAGVKERIAAWAADMRKSLAARISTRPRLRRQVLPGRHGSGIGRGGRPRAVACGLAVEDQRAMFHDRYPKAAALSRRGSPRLEKRVQESVDRGVVRPAGHRVLHRA